MPKKKENAQEVEQTVDEKELLKEAEEREKERKEKEEAQKLEEKATKAAEKMEAKEVKKAEPQKRRVLHGKKYREVAKKIEKDKTYTPEEAIVLAIETSPAKFDATVELHVKISTKEKTPPRGLVVLPGGVAKEKRVLEVTETNVDDVIAQVKAGKFDFDIMIADVKLMPKIAQLAKILGPKGLMPSPKAGTAVEDVKKAAAELKGGKVEYRADKTNIVHIALGKISFGKERIKQNYDAVIAVLPSRRMDSIHLTTTMGPSIKVSSK